MVPYAGTKIHLKLLHEDKQCTNSVELQSWLTSEYFRCNKCQLQVTRDLNQNQLLNKQDVVRWRKCNIHRTCENIPNNTTGHRVVYKVRAVSKIADTELRNFINTLNPENINSTMIFDRPESGTPTSNSMANLFIAPVTFEFLFHSIKEIIGVQILIFFHTTVQ